MDSIAVYDVKPQQLAAPGGGIEGPVDLTFNLELEHRIWLAKFKVDRRRRTSTDPASLDWDTYQTELCPPELWQPSWLATAEEYGGTWTARQLQSVDGAGPVPGDRVVVYRCEPHADVVGVWLVTGVRYGPAGAVRYSHRPLVSCLAPVPLRPARRFDADLAQCWDDTFGRGSGPKGRFMLLEGAAISGLMRTIGIDPQLLCGPARSLPDCSMSNVPPDTSFRPGTRLRTGLSNEARAEARAVAEAAHWLVSPGFGFDDVETVASNASSVCLVARGNDKVAEVVAVAEVGPSIDDLALCPTVVLEAIDALAQGRNWSLIVTLDALGVGRTLSFDALAVAACFDPRSGRVGTAT